tara:strand:+ start:1252 stop:1464 length:213 start_codon:yes stop_codon:yes gene_type:complete
MLTYLTTLFLLVNAIFWGLFPHSHHCALLAKLGIMDCPNHVIHIFMGIASFLGAVVNQQGLMFWNPKTWA